MLLKLTGSLSAGPAEGVSTGFATLTITDQIGFPGEGLTFQVSTGVQTAGVNSPSSYTTLQGLGTGAPVTKGTFLYVKSNSTMLLRITFDDGSGGDIVSVIPITPNAPPLIIPCDVAKFAKLLEVQGSGQIVYFVCGNQ